VFVISHSAQLGNSSPHCGLHAGPGSSPSARRSGTTQHERGCHAHQHCYTKNHKYQFHEDRLARWRADPFPLDGRLMCTLSIPFSQPCSIVLGARAVPSTRNLHFVQGKRLNGRGTGSFGREPRKSALQKTLYLLDKHKGTHLTRERKDLIPASTICPPRLPRPGAHSLTRQPNERVAHWALA
jgi:hypothetical protein